MKLIKALIRTSRVDPVIRGLDRQGAPGITLSGTASSSSSQWSAP